MHRIPELLCGRRIRIVRPKVRIVGLVAVRAPVAFVLSGLGVVDNHAMVAVAVRDIKLVGGPVHEHFRRAFQVLGVIAALALHRMADLHQELSVLREFEHLVVVELRFVFAAAVAANPHVALVIHGNAVIRVGPVIALARSAPMTDQVAFFVELENRRRGHAAFRGRWLRRGINLHRLEGIRSVHDPDVILCIHRHADRHALHPMIGKRLRPQGIHFKARRLHARRFRRRSFLQ